MRGPEILNDRRFQLQVSQPGERLDKLVLEELKKTIPELTRARLKELFTNGQILMNGRMASPSLRLNAGQVTVEIVGIGELAGLHVSPQAMASPEGCFLPVIHEDEDLLVLHKKSGIPSLPHAPQETQTAVGAALAHCPDLPRLPAKELEPGLLHRLDTLTSGLLVFAKTSTEHERLRKAWKSSGVEKIYRAVCTSPAAAPAPPREINWPLAHDAKQAKKMQAILPSRTHHKIRGNPLPALTRILGEKPLGEARDFEIQITTGVMHQIRCHLATAGWPIAGDPIYHGAPATRLWLHAWKLSLPLRSGTILKLEAALPENWPTVWPPS